MPVFLPNCHDVPTASQRHMFDFHINVKLQKKILDIVKLSFLRKAFNVCVFFFFICILIVTH